MFYCPDCGYEFESPIKAFESHGFTSPPFEEVLCCPNCNGQSFRVKNTTHCRCCGIKLPSDRKEYCSDACSKKGKKMWLKEIKRRNEEFSNPLNKMIRECSAYNKAHGTNYSYGEYVAFIKKGNK